MTALACGLQEKGHNIEFFIYYPQYTHFLSEINERNIQVHRYTKRSRFDPRVVIELRKILRTESYDGILSFLKTPNVYAELGNYCGEKIPLIVSERSAYPYGKISIGRKMREQLHRLATHVTVNSHHHRESMVRIHPWMKSKISTIYNGVDLHLYKPAERQHIKRSSPTRFLIVGNIRPLKNVIGLIKAQLHYKQYFGEPPEIKWAGKLSKNRNDRKTFSIANKLIADNGLGNYWQWLGERSDIIELLQQHDALILGSFYEGLPNAICEAFACGKPVLASNVCDHPNLVNEGITGFLFNPYDPVDIANCIHRFTELDQDKKISMGMNARLFAEENLSMERYVAEYERLFNQLLNIDA